MSFHKFNEFTGSIRQSTQIEALYPLTPRKLEIVQAPTMAQDLVKPSKSVSEKTNIQERGNLPRNFHEICAKFQRDPTIPTYLLRGWSDKMLYHGCIAITAISFVWNMYYIVKVIKKY